MEEGAGRRGKKRASFYDWGRCGAEAEVKGALGGGGGSCGVGNQNKGPGGAGGRRRGRNVSEGGAGCRGECAGSVGNQSLMGPLLRVH